MVNSRRVAAPALLLSLTVLAACGEDATPESSSPATSASPSTSATTGTGTGGGEHR